MVYSVTYYLKRRGYSKSRSHYKGFTHFKQPNCFPYPNEKHQISIQSLNNSNFANKRFYRNWYSKNVISLIDLLDENGEFYEFLRFKNTYHIIVCNLERHFVYFRFIISSF
jgi:hypothetical protein